MKSTVTKDESPCYIARYPCGCIYAAIVDDPIMKGNSRRIAKFIMDEVKFGGTIERVTAEFIRNSEDWCFRCTHGNNPKDKKKPVQQEWPK
jgi:hypothetical protein